MHFCVFDRVDCEIDLEDVQRYATLEDFPDTPADVIWMNRQFFNVLAQKLRGNPFQAENSVSEQDGCCGAGVCLQGKNASRSQKLTKRVHDIKCVSSHPAVVVRMEMWEVKENVKDTGCDVADTTMANCLRRIVPIDLSADLQKMSHIVRCSDSQGTS